MRKGRINGTTDGRNGSRPAIMDPTQGRQSATTILCFNQKSPPFPGPAVGAAVANSRLPVGPGLGKRCLMSSRDHYLILVRVESMIRLKGRDVSLQSLLLQSPAVSLLILTQSSGFTLFYRLLTSSMCVTQFLCPTSHSPVLTPALTAN